MIRNLDVIWQTMGSRRSLLFREVTCSEGHFREIGLAACGGWKPRREKPKARINQEFIHYFKGEITELRDGPWEWPSRWKSSCRGRKFMQLWIIIITFLKVKRGKLIKNCMWFHALQRERKRSSGSGWPPGNWKKCSVMGRRKELGKVDKISLGRKHSFGLEARLRGTSEGA